MRIGIGSWTYAWSIGVPDYPQPEVPLTAAALFARAAELGVGVVQIADNLKVNCHDLKAIERGGIEIELGTRGTAPALLRRYLELAATSGAKLVRTMIDEDLDRAARDLREVLPEYERMGIVLAIENYERHSAADLSAFIAAFANPYCGVCLDTVNSFGSLETPDQVVDYLAPFVVSLHVKDFEIERVPYKMGFRVTGRPAGGGRLKLPWILSCLEKYRRKPNLIVELWTPWLGTLEPTIALEEKWARESVAFLKQFEGAPVD